MSSSGGGCLLALASLLLLGQPSHGMWQSKPQSSQPFGFWSREDSIRHQAAVWHSKALHRLGEEHNCTYRAAPGEKIYVSVWDISGQFFNFRTTVVKVKCPEEQKEVSLKHCEIIPGLPKYLCQLQVVTFPAFHINLIKTLGCKEAPTSTSPPVISVELEPEKEEGTPYM